MEGTIPVTQDTLAQLQSELEKLKKMDRPRIIEEIAAARAQGDLRENAEYHAAKDRQGEIEDRIRYLEDRIARAVVLTHDTGASPHVTFGATVQIRNLSTGRTQEYTLVSPDAVDVANGKISSSSPVGKALIGKSRGDTVNVVTPKGPTQLQIIDYR